jgi:hypothetical protein
MKENYSGNYFGVARHVIIESRKEKTIMSRLMFSVQGSLRSRTRLSLFDIKFKAIKYMIQHRTLLRTPENTRRSWDGEFEFCFQIVERYLPLCRLVQSVISFTCTHFA